MPKRYRTCAHTLVMALSWLAMALPSLATPKLDVPTVRSCGSVQVPCKIAAPPGGKYYAVTPPNWDGKSRIGALVFFHGYRSSGRAFIKKSYLRRLAARLNSVLITPDGKSRTWAFRNSASKARDEIAFVTSLLRDVERRFPIDKSNIVAAGFSMGGSMTWDLACRMGDTFKAFLPIAGTFWNPLPDTCETGSVNIFHVHGTNDRVVPIKGRPIGNWQQGNLWRSVDIVSKLNLCTTEPSKAEINNRFSCRTYTGCGSGHQLKLCLHKGGHKVPTGWANMAYDFLADVEPRSAKGAPAQLR